MVGSFVYQTYAVDADALAMPTSPLDEILRLRAQCEYVGAARIRRIASYRAVGALPAGRKPNRRAFTAAGTRTGLNGTRCERQSRRVALPHTCKPCGRHTGPTGAGQGGNAVSFAPEYSSRAESTSSQRLADHLPARMPASRSRRVRSAPSLHLGGPLTLPMCVQCDSQIAGRVHPEAGR